MLKYTKGIKQSYLRVGLRKINISVERGATFDESTMDPVIVQGLLSTGDFELVKTPAKKTKIGNDGEAS